MEELELKEEKIKSRFPEINFGTYVTELCITTIALASLFFLELEAKDIVIAAVAGLTGFLNNSNKRKRATDAKT